MQLMLPHEPVLVKSVAAGPVPGGLIPRRPERHRNGAEGRVRPGLVWRGAACAEARQFGSIRGAHRHCERGVIACDRTLHRHLGRRYRRGVGLKILYSKPYTLTAVVLLALIAIGQLLRFVLGWHVTVNGVTIPVWLSGLAFVVAGGLALMVWRARAVRGTGPAAADRGGGHSSGGMDRVGGGE